MAHRPRKEMIAETRSKLVAAARQAFGTVGYAEASMDDFTAAAGLTRGALYHHFGDKKGLLVAVIAQIDAEMTQRLNAVSARAETPWQAFVDECTAYIEMAVEPEIQRIVHCDGPAVLGDPWQWPSQNGCIASMTRNVAELAAEGLITDVDPEAAARLINGATLHAAQWIANADDPEATSKKAVAAFKAFLSGLLRK
jgi:AcrR family transcriptional regulator